MELIDSFYSKLQSTTSRSYGVSSVIGRTQVSVAISTILLIRFYIIMYVAYM